MILLALSLILFLVLFVLYVMRRVIKQEQHLNKLKQVMMERKQKEEEQSKIAKERTVSFKTL